MRKNAAFIALVAVLAILVTGAVSALTSNVATDFNGIELTSGDNAMSAFADETVPVRVTFVADENMSDVRIKVWLEGYRSDVSVSTNRFNVVDGSTYTKLLSLKMPADLKDITKDFTLHVSVASAENYVPADYTLKMQRSSYDYNVLSVDYPSDVSAGDIVPISVVVENTGMEELKNGYVLVSIPDLDISVKGYLGDLIAVDNDNSNKEDSVQKIVYLKMPADTEEDVYDMTVKVYNADASTTLDQLLKVGGSASSVLATTKIQDIKAGETKAFELILVNSGKQTRTFNLQADSSGVLGVSVPSIVIVGAGSSKTVQVSVTASSDAGEGVKDFSVIVDGKSIDFKANVIPEKASSIVALTVILAIVFVILLVVLIVLLTRKEKPSEEVETSYY